jgi:hypothetical protein
MKMEPSTGTQRPPAQPPPSWPPLPQISGDPDILLDIYTHDSIQFVSPGSERNKEYGDTNRLALMGRSVYDLFAVEALFKKEPTAPEDQLKAALKNAHDHDSLNDFVTHYGLREKIRCTQETKNLLKNKEETAKIWYSYMGALYLRNGTTSTKSFVARLVDPEASVPQTDDTPRHSSPPPGQMSGMGHYPSQQNTSLGSQQYPTNQPPMAHLSGYMSQNQPAPPPQAPPPLPPTPAPFQNQRYGSTGIPANHVTLALMNQTAVQRRYQVTYTQVNHGPPHMPTWYCACFCESSRSYTFRHLSLTNLF